jgi:hypothetical protein
MLEWTAESNIEGITLIEGVLKRSAEENIWTWERESNSRLEKLE